MSDASMLGPLDDADQTLRSQVRPENWTNPKPDGRYNLVVVGGGTAGLVTAAGAAALGAKVALVEHSLLGGDCLNVGCVPSKALIRSASVAATARNGPAFGIRVAGVEVEFSDVMQRMRRLRASLSPHDSASRFASLGVDVYFGRGEFSDRGTLDVNGTPLEFRRAVIATGSRPTEPPIPGLREAAALTNETLFALSELPRRLIVLGGGPIGCETAQAFARFGSSVTLIQKSDRILPRDDQDAAALVEQAMSREGIKFVFGAEVTRVDSKDGEKTVVVTAGGQEHLITGDAILVAVGRSPNVERMGLEAAGVAWNPRDGVEVNDRLQTTNSRIYAAGDVCSKFRFTHAADAMARIAVRNALFHGRSKASRLVIPWCTFTSPELAHVGLSPNEAEHAAVELSTYEQPLTGVDRAVLDGQDEGFVRIHCRRGSDRIVAATIVGPSAGELVGEIATAISRRIGLRTFASAIQPYPTYGEAFRKLGDQCNRKRLTPMRQKVLQKWFGWMR